MQWLTNVQETKWSFVRGYKKLEDELYDADAGMLYSFLDLLATHAKIARWKALYTINWNNIIAEYGTITIEECRDQEFNFFVLDNSGNILLTI